ncbi:MAG: hypothetical protein IKJ68_04775 [Clostridia bacterium]|nr:hypothetical protein [Clostridia bacterium]
MIENALYMIGDETQTEEFVPARKSIFITYLLCLMLAVVYSRTLNSLVGYLNIFIILITLCITTKKETFLFLLGLQFFNNVIPFSLGSSAMGFLLPAYIIVFIRHYTVDAGKISTEILMIVSIFFLEVININNNPDKPYASIANWVLSLWFFVEFSKQKMYFDIHEIIVYFSVAVWAICIINILEEYFVLGRTLEPNMYGNWLTSAESSKLASFDGRDIMLRFGTAYKSVEGTNGLTFDLALGICMCLFGMTARIKKYRIFYMTSILFFFYFGFLTISRGFYVEMLILVIAFFYSGTKSANRMLINLFITLLVVFVFGIFFMGNVEILFDAVMGRFDEGNDSRDSLLQLSIKLFFADDGIILFGAGSHYPYIYHFTAHNMIFDSLLSLGAVGCTLFYGLILKSYRRIRSYSRSKFNLFNYTPLIMLISYRMISGCVKDHFFYYLILVCVIFTQYNHEGEGEDVCLTSR